MASISLEHVSIEFPIYNARARRLTGELFRRAVGGRIKADAGSHVSVVALRDVCLELRDGDRLGLIGHNGAGKSTLLRVLAGIYEPIAGRVSIEGTVASLTDITMGIDLEASGYENIVLRGVFLGLPVKDARGMIPEVEAFTGLGEFLQLPLRTYSSGMLLRLAFAVTTAVIPEILIMDEMIGAADASFAAKAAARLNQMITDSRILVIASHDVEIIRRFCNRAALMETGRIVRLEGVDQVVAAYAGGSVAEPDAAYTHASSPDASLPRIRA
jgi:ABC-2 type transport system ATP-binding protein/lipopolysaccharide transport system ATP-binding protein